MFIQRTKQRLKTELSKKAAPRRYEVAPLDSEPSEPEVGEECEEDYGKGHDAGFNARRPCAC